MILDIRLRGRAAAGALVVCTAVVCALLTRLVLFNFIVFSLSDSGSPVRAGALEAARGYFPSSARLNARSAEAHVSDPARDLGLADSEIERATRLSPYDYKLRAVLAAVKESQQDLAGAERALRDAESLAPSNIELRWRLANLLLRAGKIADALTEFRAATTGDQSLIPMTLDLVWSVTGGDLRSLQSVTPSGAPARLSLASFLLKRGLTSEAVQIFEGIDPEARRSSPGSAEFINSIINTGEVGLARLLWINLVCRDSERVAGGDGSIIWNGGFESDPIPGLAQFDWSTGESSYAAISVDSDSAHQGSRSIRIDFAGRDTTRLDGELKQCVVLSRGSRYRIEFYVRTQELVTTEGPRVTVRCDTEPAWNPAGPAIAAGTGDWRKMEFDFVTPYRAAAPASMRRVLSTSLDLSGKASSKGAGGQTFRSPLPGSTDSIAATVRLVRIPKFSYDEPMRGTIWLDDFRIVELGQR